MFNIFTAMLGFSGVKLWYPRFTNQVLMTVFRLPKGQNVYLWIRWLFGRWICSVAIFTSDPEAWCEIVRAVSQQDVGECGEFFCLFLSLSFMRLTNGRCARWGAPRICKKKMLTVGYCYDTLLSITGGWSHSAVPELQYPVQYHI